MNKIRVAKLDGSAFPPVRKFPTDAGMDLYSLNYYRVPPNDFIIMHTGITVEIPKGYMGLIYPKSRNNHLIGGGIIDETYQGELLVKYINYSDEWKEVAYGEAIGQLIILPIITPEIEFVELDEIHKERTERGSTGGIITQISKLEPLE